MGGLTVADRLDALARAVVAGRDVLPPDVLATAAAVEDRAGHRMRLSAEHTVVAFAGATGSGKSSLVNAVTGTEIAAVDVLRPTTAEALALVRGEEGSGALLDWLGVRRRHVLDPADGDPAAPPGSAAPGSAGVGPGDGGLVLLDLPDHDSVVVEHRLEAERLVALVDLMVWVVDPQKYADAALHDRYLRGLAGHRDVLLVALNQVDRLSPAERDACAADLARLLADDGLAGVPVLLTSARTGEGVEALRERLDDAARRREAATARTVADVRDVAERIRRVSAPGAAVPPAARRDLVRGLERAAGVPLVADAVRAGWAARGRRATGWPPTRWLARFRPDPLRRLHLGRTTAGDAQDPDAEVVRTSLPAPGPAEEAKGRAAVRAYVDAVTAGAPDAWVLHARSAPDHEGLADALDHAVGATPVLPARRPAWWAAVGVLQWLLLAVLVGGAAWLGGLAALASLQLPTPPPPTWGEVPWPTVALLGGAAAGLLLALVARVAVGVGARRRAARATTRLHDAVGGVADRRVVDPVAQVLGRMAACHADATTAASEPGRRGRAR